MEHTEQNISLQINNMRDKWSVYVHTTPSGKRYVGCTSRDPEIRWRKGKGYEMQMFGRAIQKYGWDNIRHEIIKRGLTHDEAML